MSLTTMYPAKNNSPITTLSEGINSSDTSMTVANPSVLPSAPNLAVIGSADTAEIVLYTAISGSTVTIVRGQNGTTPGTWTAGTPVARNFTAADHEALRQNILDLDARKTDTGHTHDDRYYTESEVDTLLTPKAPLASPQFTGTPSAPTPIISNDSTQLATTAFVHLRGLYHATGNISAGSTKTFSANGITATMRVINVVFSDPTNVTSDVTWTTADGSVTFTGTFSGATTIDFDLVETDSITLS